MGTHYSILCKSFPSDVRQFTFREKNYNLLDDGLTKIRGIEEKKAHEK